MKVHPTPRKRSVALRYGVVSQPNACRQKNLRRLPHVFAKVLELPFRSNADVSISETPDALRFAAAAAAGDIGGGVQADAVEVCPGVTKVVVRGGGVVDAPGAEFELDRWRFRLPDFTRPELASAACEGGEVVVTVPKGAAAEMEEVLDDDAEDGNYGMFVIVK